MTDANAAAAFFAADAFLGDADVADAFSFIIFLIFK
jgi:hypothetical protein